MLFGLSRMVEAHDTGMVNILSVSMFCFRAALIGDPSSCSIPSTDADMLE